MEDSEKGVIGNPNPDWRGGIGTSVQWKGFELSALFEGSFGGDVWNGTKGVLYNFGTHVDTGNEVTVSASEATSIKNFDGKTIASLATANADGSYTVRGNLHDFGGGTVLLDEAWYTSRGGGFGNVAEQFVEEATWVKLRQITLNYTIPKEWTKRSGFEKVQIGISGRNIFTWTNVDGFDPESNLTGVSKARGLQYFNNPGIRSYAFSVKLGF